MDFGVGGKAGFDVTVSADAGGLEVGGAASASAGEPLRCLATVMIAETHL